MPYVNGTMSGLEKIIVIGGGIGGLTVALALLQRGFDVEIFEQSPELREIGAGVQISSNGTRVLHALGLADRLARICAVPAGKQIRLWNTGQTWKLFDLGAVSVERYGFPFITVHRGDLQTLLAEAIIAHREGAIRLGHTCIDLRQSDSTVEARFTNGEIARAPVVIGADGVHSNVRSSLFGVDAPEVTGCIAWRGLVPFARLPPQISRTIGTNWIGAGGHVVHYPVRAGEMLNFVAILERDDWKIESWTIRGTTEELLKNLTGWHEDVRIIAHNVDVPYKWALMVRRPMASWTCGRVTLVGDACHSTLPMLAQGACMALEDGLVLARCLKKYAGDHATAFARYETARMRRAARIVEGSAEQAQRFHNDRLADAAGAEEFVAREWREERVKERYEWLFVYDATTAEI
jgi:salicylate hydroxylase